MAFQILDKNDKAIKINQLDAEACKLWNKEIHEKSYAYPQHKPDSFPTKEYKTSWEFYSLLTNWFDKIGWKISEGCEDWDELIKDIMLPFIEFDAETILEIRNEYVPVSGYIQLIEFWKESGYKPKQVKD